MRTFIASEFVPSKFSAAEEKAKFANHFVRFVSKGFPRSLFTKAFYKRLSNTFGHIAHYDINGFFDTFFETPQDQCRFLKICVQHGGCYGDPGWTFSDVERSLVAWIAESGAAEQVAATANADTRQREIDLRDRLLAKHPLAQV